MPGTGSSSSARFSAQWSSAQREDEHREAGVGAGAVEGVRVAAEASVISLRSLADANVGRIVDFRTRIRRIRNRAAANRLSAHHHCFKSLYMRQMSSSETSDMRNASQRPPAIWGRATRRSCSIDSPMSAARDSVRVGLWSWWRNVEAVRTWLRSSRLYSNRCSRRLSRPRSIANVVIRC